MLWLHNSCGNIGGRLAGDHGSGVRGDVPKEGVQAKCAICSEEENSIYRGLNRAWRRVNHVKWNHVPPPKPLQAQSRQPFKGMGLNVQ
jgi:hypothetical protein